MAVSHFLEQKKRGGISQQSLLSGSTGFRQSSTLSKVVSSLAFKSLTKFGRKNCFYKSWI